MSSTDERRKDQRLRQYFAQVLVPAADRLRARGVRLMPLGPEPEADTWYVPGPSGEPEFVEFDVEDCERIMRAFWEAQGCHELAEMAGQLAELAQELEIGEEESSDVSPFIYVMF